MASFNQKGQEVGKQVNIGETGSGFIQTRQKVDVQINLNSSVPFPERLPDGLRLIESGKLPNQRWKMAAPTDATAVFNQDKKRTKVDMPTAGGTETIYITDDGELRWIRSGKTTKRYIIGYNGKVVVNATGASGQDGVDVSF